MFTTRRHVRTPAVAAAALVLALTAAGCTGDDEDGPAGERSAGPAADGVPLVQTTAKIGRVVGTGFPEARRETLKSQVKPVVDAWVDGAFIGGTWPRSDVGEAFSGFTAGARRDAERDLGVLSNADIGDRVTTVTATRRQLHLDVLAVKRRAAAVTARLLLQFDTTGEVTRSETVRARLFLTRGRDGWQVFGYDVSAGDGAAATDGGPGTGGQRGKGKQKQKGAGR